MLACELVQLLDIVVGLHLLLSAKLDEILLWLIEIVVLWLFIVLSITTMHAAPCFFFKSLRCLNLA